MPTALEILQKYWGYTSFRGEQENIIASVLAGKDTLALLPTGGGKSVCFQIPALMKEGLCLVISPLIALMKDQVESLNNKGIPALAINSSMNYFEVRKTFSNAVHGNFKFLYVSPERLETKLFQEYLYELDINLIAVDEAHCISQWGYDFRPPYMRIAKLKEALPQVPMIALTASATIVVQKDIIEKLLFKHSNIFKQSFQQPHLSFSVFCVDSKINKAIDILNNVPGSSVVYCRNRRETQKVVQLLRLHNISSDYYHAGLSQDERSNRQENWIQNKTRVMVCTNAFGMGIDKPDVRTVIHYDIPDCLENYYQEAGRAGRDGRRAYAILLYQTTDEKELIELPASKYVSFDTIKNIYQHIADFLQIPVGAGEGSYFNFNLIEFCGNFKQDAFVVMNVLKLLQQEGHLSFSEQIFIPSKIKFIASNEEIRIIEDNQVNLSETIKCLLRTYEGIWDVPVSIQEKRIAKMIRLSEEQLVQNLKQLDALGILQYQPQKETPQLYFIVNRAPAKHLYIDYKGYVARKKNYTEKVEKMQAYLHLQAQCRSRFIADYFGDEQTKPCHICDICIQSKGVELTEEEFKAIEVKLYDLLQSEGILVKELLVKFKRTKKENLWKVIEFLKDKEQINIDSGGMMHLLSNK